MLRNWFDCVQQIMEDDDLKSHSIGWSLENDDHDDDDGDGDGDDDDFPDLIMVIAIANVIFIFTIRRRHLPSALMVITIANVIFIFIVICHQHRRRFALISATSVFVWPKHLQGTRNRLCYRLCRWRATALRASFAWHSLAPLRRQALPARSRRSRGIRGPAGNVRGSSTPRIRRRGSWSSRRA